MHITAHTHTNCFSGKKWRYLWVSNLFLRVMLILVTSVLRRLRQSLLTINTFSHETVTGDVVDEAFIYYSQDDKTRRALKTDIIAETKKRQSYQDCWCSMFHRLVPAADYWTVKGALTATRSTSHHATMTPPARGGPNPMDTGPATRCSPAGLALSQAWCQGGVPVPLLAGYADFCL